MIFGDILVVEDGRADGPSGLIIADRASEGPQTLASEACIRIVTLPRPAHGGAFPGPVHVVVQDCISLGKTVVTNPSNTLNSIKTVAVSNLDSIQGSNNVAVGSTPGQNVCVASNACPPCLST